MNKTWCWTCDHELSERFRFGNSVMLECGHIQCSESELQESCLDYKTGEIFENLLRKERQPKYVIRIIGSMSQFRINALNEGLNVENNSIKIFEYDTIERLKRGIDWLV